VQVTDGQVTETTSNIREQRDRFLAFSFASADLFIEINKNGTIDFTLGAAKIMTGTKESELIGKEWLDIFDESDRPSLKAMKTKAKPAQRCGPVLVTLKNAASNNPKAIMTGICMPGSSKFYITLGFSNVLMAKTAGSIKDTHENTELDKDSFIAAAQEAMKIAKDLGQGADLTLLDLELTNDIKDRFGADKLEQLRNDIVSSLSRQSIDNHTAAEIKEGRYSIVHDKTVSPDAILLTIQDLTKQADPAQEGVKVTNKTIESDLALLTEHDTTKALVYTLNEFERKGTELTINNLNTSFKAYMAANTQRISDFKTWITQLSFHIHFQPIVDLTSYEVHHFEMLTRFPNEESPYEWIIFGEDMGLAADFDMAVCERAINYLRFKSQTSTAKFAINLSGQSIQNEAFFEALLKKLKDNPETNNRILFEITESTNIESLQEVGKRVTKLQDLGYEVCLDDFGAGSASFQYLNNLHVKFVKIDGHYVHALEKSERDRAMIKNLINLCKELGIKTVGEMIETEEQLLLLRDMGCDLGQGYLFAKPSSKPDSSISAAKLPK